MSIYLNTFNREDVMSVYHYLKENQNNDLVEQDYDFEEDDGISLLVLSYCPYLHKITLEVFDSNEPLYKNNHISCELMPKQPFIDRVLNGSFN